MRQLHRNGETPKERALFSWILLFNNTNTISIFHAEHSPLAVRPPLAVHSSRAVRTFNEQIMTSYTLFFGHIYLCPPVLRSHHSSPPVENFIKYIMNLHSAKFQALSLSREAYQQICFWHPKKLP